MVLGTCAYMWCYVLVSSMGSVFVCVLWFEVLCRLSLVVFRRDLPILCVPWMSLDGVLVVSVRFGECGGMDLVALPYLEQELRDFKA